MKTKVLQLQPDCLLDIGCGDGRFIYEIKNNINVVKGVDISAKAIRFAKAFNPDVQFYCEDFRKIDEKFDLIVLMETLEHISDREIPDFIEGVAEKLVKYGKLLISVPTKNQQLNPKHYRHYDLKTLKTQLQPNFEIIKYNFLTNIYFVKVYQIILWNRFFITNISGVQRFLWKTWEKIGYHATQTTGAHIVAIAEKL